MPTYIVVASYTGQGVKNIGDAPKRLEAYRALAKSKGAKVKDFYWTLGQTDMLAIVEAPDDATIAAMSLATTGLGNVHGYTMRTFSPAEMKDVLAKM